MKSSKPICYCKNVSPEDLEKLFDKPGVTVEEIVSQTGVGQVCTSCLLDLDLFFDSFGKRFVQKTSELQVASEQKNRVGLKQKVQRRDSGVFYCDF